MTTKALYKFTASVPVLFVCAALLTLAPGCGHKHRVHSHLTGSAAGHEIAVDVEGVGGIINHNTRTFIQLPGHALEVQPDRLLLDGKESATIPASAKLEITLSNGKLTVTADGANVLSTTVTP